MADEGAELAARARAERGAGRGEAALDLYGQAAEIARRDGDIAALAHRLRHMGDIHQDRGELPSASALYDEALDLYLGLDHAPPLDLANLLRPMAILYEKLARPDWAIAAWAQAREYYVAAGVEAGVAESDRHLAQLIAL